jgi:hypothetical protein
MVSTASSRLSRNRVISELVTVTGPPFLIWSWKSGMTEPRDAKTFPYRTQMNRVPGQRRLPWMKMRSCKALVMPITLTGLQALSVETPTTVSTGICSSSMARTTFSAP